jgi:hypothetical protein
MFVIFEEKLIVYLFKTNDFRKLIYLELVVLRADGIIKELLQRYIFQNESKKIRNNF